MEIRLDDKQITRAKVETYFGPEFKKENAGTAQHKELRTFIGYCGEQAVLSAFGGSLIDESTAHIGDWKSLINKIYEIKTQNKNQRRVPYMSFDLNKDQWENVFKGAKADGGILCSVDCSSIEDFCNNPIVTIEFWTTREAIATAVPQGKSNPRINMEKSVYSTDDERVRTDYENL
jgi:hypothetical protein